MITVSVKLYGVLRRRRPDSAAGAPHQPFTFELPNGAGVDDLTTRLGISRGSVHAIAVNGQAAAAETALHDGDEVRLFPPSAGG